MPSPDRLSPAVRSFSLKEPSMEVVRGNGNRQAIRDHLETGPKSMRMHCAGKLLSFTFITLLSGHGAPCIAENPEADLAQTWQREFVYEQASFPQCHASTICETDDGLVAAWFGGTKEGHEDVGIWSSYHDGNAWSTPRQVADGIQHQDLRYPCWNPVLHRPQPDGPMLLFFKVGPSPRAWWGEWMVSHDAGRSFVDRRRLPESITGPVRSKPVVLSDGKTLLCGSSTENASWRVHFESVVLQSGIPQGTWNRIGPINEGTEFNAIQPTFLRLGNGDLQALCRTKEGVIASSSSSDEGNTWTKMKSTSLPNPNSGIEALTLKDGRHLLVFNPLDAGPRGWGKRSVLSLAVSNDGKQWTPVADLEREDTGEFSYPAMIQANDGTVHVTYTWNRQKIRHVSFDATKI
ncbi:MAG: sialidase family protein [Planctomycetota bacterium]